MINSSSSGKSPDGFDNDALAKTHSSLRSWIRTLKAEAPSNIPWDAVVKTAEEINAEKDPIQRRIFHDMKKEIKNRHFCRRLFRTRYGTFGLGPEVSRTGDEVWILAGGETPYILRRMDSGNYQLVGEAYVHGIMFGRRH